MNQLIFIVILISISHNCIAQQFAIPQAPNQRNASGERVGEWIILYDKDNKETESHLSSVFYRRLNFKNGKIQGLASDYYLNGKKKVEGILLSLNPDIYNGKVSYYNREGSIEKEVNFSNGLEEGKSTAYYTNGFKKETGNFVKGKKQGLWLYFSQDGKEIDAKLFVLGIEFTWEELIKSSEEFYYNANYQNAATLARLASDFTKHKYGDNDTNYAVCTNQLGLSYQKLGRFDEAEPLIKKTLEISQSSYGLESLDFAICSNNLAVFYWETGRFEEALPLAKMSLEIRRKLLGEAHQSYAKALGNLGMLYWEMGQKEEAEPLLKQTAEIMKRQLGVESEEYASSLDNLAGFYMENFNYKEADSLYKIAGEIFKNKLGENHPDYAINLRMRGNLNYFSGDYSFAEKLFIQSKEIFKKIYGEEHTEYAESVNCLAKLYYSMNRFNEADKFFKVTLGKKINIILKYFPFLSEKEKEQFWNKEKDQFEIFYTFAVRYSAEEPEILGDMYDYCLMTKALVLNSTKKIMEQIRKSNDTNTINKFEILKSIKEKWLTLIANAYLSNEDNASLDSLLKSANELEKELTINSSQFYKLVTNQYVSWKDIQKSLSKDEAAIEIIRFRNFDKFLLNDSIYYAALIITTETKFHPELVLFENSFDFDLKSILKYRIGISLSKINKEPTKELIDLYDGMWSKISYKINGIKTIYISLDGIYNMINLQTLINPSTQKYLLDEFNIHVVTNTKDILKITKETDSKGIQNNALLIGYPNFDLDINTYKKVLFQESESMLDNDSTGQDLSRNVENNINKPQWVSLPGTKQEIEKIDSIIKVHGIGSNKFIYNNAIEEKVKAIQNPRMLHIATHGFFINPANKKKNLSIGLSRTFSENLSKNPLLESGLVFSGANTISRIKNSVGIQNFETQQNMVGTQNLESQQNMVEIQNFESLQLKNFGDGILTAYEAMNLNLDSTELVVLSACETGLGEIKNGEGVYGLQRAFQVAGAKSLIMSLWPVSDEATQDLMTSFYDKWLSGKTKRIAFREAQIELKKNYPGFYYWGAFIMIGE